MDAPGAGRGGSGLAAMRLWAGPPPSKQRSTSSANTRVASGLVEPRTKLVTWADPVSKDTWATQGSKGSFAVPVALARPQTAKVWGMAWAKT
jgi:hypothetical protein